VTGAELARSHAGPAIPVSVVIVSRGRPAALLRCLTSVAQQLHPLFEVVVVADPQGVAAITPRWASRIKILPFDVANISAARNLGLAHAAGEVAAFIDDDAVAEPTWLLHLAAVFEDAGIAAAGGFVRGRNGISWQWQARDIAPDGEGRPIAVDPVAPTVLTGSPGRGIKTEGTNMAFRRSVVAGAGGFDPVFRFYLDESDLNLRLGQAGLQTAIVPLAQVHHGFAASHFRREDRVPRDLHEIGASLAAFLRKHRCPDSTAKLQAEAQVQRQRLIGHMIAGRVEPRDVGRIMETFLNGIADGMERPLADLPALGDPVAALLPFVPEKPARAHRVLSARCWNAAATRDRAKELAAEGFIVSLYIFSPSARYQSIRYEPEGYWLQKGGLFGRSERGDPLFRLWTFDRRLDREVRRLEDVRYIGD
jgi:O-antigen biosynthesis protein